jgi:hypothetical protein
MMQTATEILNFNFSPAALQQAAKAAFPSTVIQLYELRIDKLKRITEKVGETSFKFEGESMYPKVFKKFKIAINDSQQQIISVNNLDKRELKTLSYCLDYSESNKIFPIIASVSDLNVALRTLERSWKDAFLFGLLHCYLKNWESKHIDSFRKLNEFIFEKLKQYDGGRTVLNSFKTNVKFFDLRNGDVVLGSELAIKNKRIKDAARFLSLPDSWFTYPYFSKVIVAYYDKRKSNIEIFLDDLNNALNEHNNSISNKRLISKLIIQANTNEYVALQDKVKSIAFRLVGDPGNAANWTSFEIATENEKEDLKKARIILNEWITRQFINVFFEKCINDLRRKRFWLKYAKEITQFRVVGSTYIRQLLMTDNRISEYVSPRFGNTNSSRDSNAALMFTMKDHLFIEFSDTGAFYAYKLSNKNAPSIESSFFESTSSLKTPSMNLLAYRTGYYIERTYDEGRLGHNDGDLHWEQVAIHWLKNIAGIDV